MKLGLGSYAFMWSIGFQGPNPAYPDRAARPAATLTAIGLLEKARDLGIHLVQTGPNLPLPENELDQFIQAARDWDITLELGTRGLDPGHIIRQAALANRITYYTSMAGCEAAVEGMKHQDDLVVVSLQELHRQLRA